MYRDRLYNIHINGHWFFYCSILCWHYIIFKFFTVSISLIKRLAVSFRRLSPYHILIISHNHVFSRLSQNSVVLSWLPWYFMKSLIVQILWNFSIYYRGRFAFITTYWYSYQSIPRFVLPNLFLYLFPRNTLFYSLWTRRAYFNLYILLKFL